MKLSAELAKSIFPHFDFGDMAIQDLSPKDANSGGRIIKNLRICGSGLYEYHVSEAPLMGLVIPSDYNGDTFKMFRSPEVLVANKDLYARVPIITGHHVRVNTANAKQLAVGMVGDTVKSEVGEDGETYLYTTGTIIADDGIEAYEKYGELSVGYDPIVEWSEGTYKGQKYQAVLKGFNEVNHLLICKTARGGHQCMIMDSLDGRKPSESIETNGGRSMGLFKKIFAKPAEKPVHGDAKVVSALLQSICAGADAKTQVGLAQTIMGDTVDDTLKGYFEDLVGDEVAQADKETLKKAVDVVDAYCAKLLGDEVPPPEANKPKDEPGDEGEDGKKSEDKDCNCSDEDKDKDEPKDEPKANGDAIDYDRIINGVVDKLKAEQKVEEPKSNGDEVQKDEAELSRLDALISGDEKDSDALTSDKLMKDIWG